MITVMLAPDHLGDYRQEATDDPTDVQFALKQSSHTEFLGPRHAAGVYGALRELAQQLPLVRLEGTTLVAERRPADG